MSGTVFGVFGSIMVAAPSSAQQRPAQAKICGLSIVSLRELTYGAGAVQVMIQRLDPPQFDLVNKISRCDTQQKRKRL